MDIPPYRVEPLNKNNLQWLYKKLGKRNSDHPQFEEAMRVIEHKLENGDYTF